MNRIARTVATLALGLTLAAVGGAGVAGAQEMEHGRTRPVTRELRTNQEKTVHAVTMGVVANVRA